MHTISLENLYVSFDISLCTFLAKGKHEEKVTVSSFTWRCFIVQHILYPETYYFHSDPSFQSKQSGREILDLCSYQHVLANKIHVKLK